MTLSKSADAAATPAPLPTSDQIISAQFPQLLGKTFLGSAAALAALRGLYGVGRTINHNLATPSSALSKQFPVHVPTEEEQQQKAAADTGNPLNIFANALSGASDYVARRFSGAAATGLSDYPHTVAGLTLAGVGGGLGGWKLTDWILDERRKQQMKADLDAAKARYEAALLPAGSKQANDLGQALDELFVACQDYKASRDGGETKQASGDPLGYILNAYEGLLLPTAGLSALAAYSLAQSGQDKKRLLEEAARQRSRRLLSAGPVFAYPDNLALPAPEGISPAKEAEDKMQFWHLDNSHLDTSPRAQQLDPTNGAFLLPSDRETMRKMMHPLPSLADKLPGDMSPAAKMLLLGAGAGGLLGGASADRSSQIPIGAIRGAVRGLGAGGGAVVGGSLGSAIGQVLANRQTLGNPDVYQRLGGMALGGGAGNILGSLLGGLAGYKILSKYTQPAEPETKTAGCGKSKKKKKPMKMAAQAGLLAAVPGAMKKPPAPAAPPAPLTAAPQRGAFQIPAVKPQGVSSALRA